jgi:hypothetical protein
MTYNHDIHAQAPLPSGALPTEAEVRRMVTRSRQQQVNTMLNSLRRVFKR